MSQDNDFFVVRERIAEDLARAHAENLTHPVEGGDDLAPAADGPVGARAWLGRRLVAVGTVLAGDQPAPEPQRSTGQSC